MNILLLEPYLTGSHAAWARGYAACSRHRVEILGLPGRHWKWRMHGGAVTLAQRFLSDDRPADLLFASAMLDLTTFLALSRRRSFGLKSALYFHENQLTYPWSPRDSDPPARRDAHYGFINFVSALAADGVLFNSGYHQQAFLDELPRFLKSFPDARGLGNVETIRRKSRVLPLGLDLRRFDAHRPAAGADPDPEPPLILWNHRWEYDKNPDDFFQALFALQDAGIAFRLAVLGESFQEQPAIFTLARQRLASRIVHFGYVADFAEYARWLWRADILPVTAVHDFFGISVVEAMYCNCHPLLPNRLAYPEHLPEEGRRDCFYRDQADLVERLKALLDPSGERRRQDFRSFVAGYDWALQGPAYDGLLSQLAE
jgi:glycosyltransferase involved in cell wall biosynthesis